MIFTNVGEYYKNKYEIIWFLSDLTKKGTIVIIWVYGFNQERYYCNYLSISLETCQDTCCVKVIKRYNDNQKIRRSEDIGLYEYISLCNWKWSNIA